MDSGSRLAFGIFAITEETLENLEARQNSLLPCLSGLEQKVS